MLKVLKHSKNTNEKVSDSAFESRVWIAYTEDMGPHTEAGKKEILTNPGIEHHPACALNEREVLWKKLVCDHVI